MKWQEDSARADFCCVDEAEIEYTAKGPLPTGVGIGTYPHGSLSRKALPKVLSCVDAATAPASGAVGRGPGPAGCQPGQMGWMLL